MILAVTHPGDEHAPPVLQALRHLRAPVAVLDLAELPRRGWFALEYGSAQGRKLRLAGRRIVEASQVTAVWWRRPRRFRAAAGLGRAHAAFAVRQAAAALMGYLALVERHALFVNHPWRDQVACHKTFQLAAAEEAGLRVPETLVVSEPAAARAFLRRQGPDGAVHKAVHATPADWRLTRRVTSRDVAGIGVIRHAPVILQERVPGVDVRVTVVGDDLFATEIDARASSSPDDFRGFERECRFAACRLPAAEARGLRRLMRDLGLTYGAADFRRRDDGAWYFLEVNPGGQWDFVEKRTGQPITAAVAALLARGERRPR